MKLRSWYTVFATAQVCPFPSLWVDSLRPAVKDLVCHAQPDEKNWTTVEMTFSKASSPLVHLSRVQIGPHNFEDEITRRVEGMAKFRNEQTQGEDQFAVVTDFLRRTRQIIHIKPVDVQIGQSKLARICEQLCGACARNSEGLIQVFQEGFFDVGGNSLFPFDPRHQLKTS